LVLAVAMGAAWRQTTFWRDSEGLWRHTLACTSRNGLAHYDLALTLANQGRLDEAIAQYRKALEIKPDDVNSLNNLAIVFVGRGQFGEAITHYREALKNDPQSAQLHYNIGYALACQGRLEEAVPQYQKALELEPRCAIAHDKYGIILAHWGWYAEALALYRSALKLQPHYAECQFYLAWLLAACPVASLRNGAEAVEHARQVDQLCAGKDPLALDCLAAAYAEVGRFPEAITTARRTLALAIEKNNRALASEVRARIALYEAGKPFRLSSSPGHGPKTK
jgi:Flp pilus assembly protein TadD